MTKTSKHCGSCDRCVDGFDHHCKWLNNCIGSLNYRLFILLINSLEASEIILFSFEVHALTKYHNRIVLALIIVDCILNFFIFLLVGYLISIHVWLKLKGITTYEYIKAKRKEKAKKINPGTQADNHEGQSLEKKSLSLNKEVKKSIIKSSTNRTVVIENPCSFSISKVAIEGGHMTMQIRSETETSNIMF